MFGEIYGYTEKSQLYLNENVHDKVGESISMELYDALEDQEKSLQAAYDDARQKMTQIARITAELRELV